MRHNAQEAVKLVGAALLMIAGITLGLRGIHNADDWTGQIAAGVGLTAAWVTYCWLNRNSK